MSRRLRLGVTFGGDGGEGDGAAAAAWSWVIFP